jgi:hypothetical protein
MLHCSNRDHVGSPLQDFNRAFKCAKFAWRKPPEPGRKRASGRCRLGQEFAACGRQPHRQAAAIVRIRDPLNEPAANQAVDRAADCGSAAPDRLGDSIQGRRLMLGDGGKQLAPGAVGSFGRAVEDETLGKRTEPVRKSLW